MRKSFGEPMIVCHCMGISDREIRAAVDWMRAADPSTLITPGKIYRALGKSAECGGCIRLFVERMRSDENFAIPQDLPEDLRNLACAARP